MEEALINFLLADTALTALLSGNINWVEGPQHVYPTMVLTRISGVRGYTHAGADGLVVSRVQCDCDSAVGYAQAKLIARALRNRLSGYRGTWAGVEFQSCFIDGGDRDDFVDGQTPDNIYRTSVDYIITHKES